MWKKLTGLGMLGVLFYVLHVVLGGILWQGYNHLMQPISDLTAMGAPDRQLLSVFTVCYEILCMGFAVAAFMYLRKHIAKIACAGIILYFAMQLVSLSYAFFPEDLPGAAMTFPGLMHIVVTYLIVPLTILAPIFIGVGFRKNEALRKFGIYSIITGFFILIAGGTSTVFFAQKLPYFGLVERLNIGSLQVWTFLLSLKLFAGKEILKE